MTLFLLHKVNSTKRRNRVDENSGQKLLDSRHN
jgi:hypothetical protein